MKSIPPAQRFLRREIHYPETQDTIYQAAVQLFCERGYHAASIREIATAAHIQPATIYHYYGNKEALLFTIMERVILELLKLQEGVLSRSANPVEQLREMVRVHVRFHCEHRAEAFVGDYELRGLGDELLARHMVYRDRYQAAFRSILEAGVGQNVFAVPDVHMATNALLVMATGAVLWYRPDGRLSLEEFADMHATLVLRAVLPAREEHVLEPHRSA